MCDNGADVYGIPRSANPAALKLIPIQQHVEELIPVALELLLSIGHLHECQVRGKLPVQMRDTQCPLVSNCQSLACLDFIGYLSVSRWAFLSLFVGCVRCLFVRHTLPRTIRCENQIADRCDARKRTAMRRRGLRLAERGGKNGKKRAVIATERKLAVLLHRLWLS